MADVEMPQPSAESRLYDFALLVKSLREHQKAYFRTRNNAALENSKRIERIVDAQVDAILNPGLFASEAPQ